MTSKNVLSMLVILVKVRRRRVTTRQNCNTFVREYFHFLRIGWIVFHVCWLIIIVQTFINASMFPRLYEGLASPACPPWRLCWRLRVHCFVFSKNSKVSWWTVGPFFKWIHERMFILSRASGFLFLIEKYVSMLSKYWSSLFSWTGFSTFRICWKIVPCYQRSEECCYILQLFLFFLEFFMGCEMKKDSDLSTILSISESLLKLLTDNKKLSLENASGFNPPWISILNPPSLHRRYLSRLARTGEYMWGVATGNHGEILIKWRGIYARCSRRIFPFFPFVRMLLTTIDCNNRLMKWTIISLHHYAIEECCFNPWNSC